MKSGMKSNNTMKYVDWTNVMIDIEFQMNIIQSWAVHYTSLLTVAIVDLTSKYMALEYFFCLMNT